MSAARQSTSSAGDRSFRAALVRALLSAYISAMAHVHHSHTGTDLSHAAQTTMEKSGEQWTTMRAAVFEALASFERPASAYDIAEKVSQDQGRRVAANSVYRILDLFVGANLARKVESANAYVANDHPDCLHDCIFLICDACGQATHLDDDRLTGGVREAARAAGFAPDRPVIEVRGRCGDCEAD
jgi:Fur family zinc uptake transcriptional regulator